MSTSVTTVNPMATRELPRLETSYVDAVTIMSVLLFAMSVLYYSNDVLRHCHLSRETREAQVSTSVVTVHPMATRELPRLETLLYVDAVTCQATRH